MTDAEKEALKKALKDKRLVVIGTSGSHDYLKDTTGDRRFWPVRVPSAPSEAPLSPEDRAVIDKLVATSGKWIVEPKPSSTGNEAACDGIHDEGAPTQYLCTRCFPDGGDLATHEDVTQDDVRQDHDEEME